LNPDVFSAPPPQASGFHWILIRIYTTELVDNTAGLYDKKESPDANYFTPYKSLNLLESSVKLKNSSLSIIPGPHPLLF